MDKESNVVRSVMNEIYNLNPDVYTKMVNNGRLDSMEYSDLLEIKRRLKSDRIEVNAKMKPVNNTTLGGFKVEFLGIYNSLLMEDTEEIMGVIEIGGMRVNYDIQVIRAIKSLLFIGITPNEDLANACRYLVEKVVMLGSTTSYVTVSQVVSKLKELKETGIKNEVVKALLEVLV